MTSAPNLLLETARRGELHHAIILHGPKPQPLRDLSIRIAKTLNCLGGTTGDACLSCQKIDRRLHPDVHFVEVGAEKKLISVEQIRDLVSAATLRPYEGANKVFVVDPADALSAHGSNALLKTLEEPARDTTFILLTRFPDLLLPTIRSRSQSIYVGERPIRPIGESLEQSRLDQLGAYATPEERSGIAETMSALLARFAERRDSAALLGLAAFAASQEEVKEAIALLAVLLTHAAGSASSIDPRRRLAASDALLAAIRSTSVNADIRLVIEGALAELVAPRG